jgi:elongation factor 2
MAEKMVDKVKRVMQKPTHIRNICTSAHIDHGKTTFSDSLLAGAGMMSEEKAGKQLVLDFHEDEQLRGITIDAANVSMVHEFEGEEHLINLIDTPGHVDFGGDVTRAMRAIDGTIVLVCAVEGIMPQTESVLRQALKERVKPVLFINKVDRLIKELKLTPEAMQERFINVINNFNRLIRELAEKEYREKWQVNVNEGSVAFGSAFHKWALSFPYMKKHGITFKDVIDAYESGKEERVKELAKKAPLHKIALNMAIKHHPNPIEAQKYRIPKIWHGDAESETGKALLNCNPDGPIAFVCTKIVIDKHAGEVTAGRLFSGTIKSGDTVYLINAKTAARIQQVSVYNGAKRETVDAVPAGNVIGLVGLKGVFSGETISSDPDMEAFEAIKHIFEPVVTKAIEAKKPSDLPKLVEVLRQVSKEDPTIKIQINEETGEHIMTGMGELHLEVIENRIKTEKGVDIVTSNPIVVYRETITKASGECEGKSPNKHNKFYMKVEPLEESIYKAIKRGEIPEIRLKKKEMEIWGKLEECGMNSKVTRKVKSICNGNVLIDATRGIVHIGEVIDMVIDAFEDIMNNGTIAREPCIKIKAILTDTKLHEDSIHRGPAQVLPAVRESLRGAMLQATPVLFEPLQTLQIEAPLNYMGSLSKLIQNKRGQLLDMQQEGNRLVIKAKIPVAESFGLTSELRSATGGRGSYYVIDQLFEKLPYELQDKIARQIRERKGLKLIDGVAMRA